MMESKLQKKTIRQVLQIYGLVFLASLILSYFLVIRPLKENAVQSYTTQNDYILDEVDNLLHTIVEYTNFIAYSEDFLEKLDAYLRQPEDENIRYDLETVLYNSTNLKQGIQSVTVEPEGFPLVYSILEPKQEEWEILESDWYQRIKQSGYSGGFSSGITIQEGESKVKILAYSKSFRVKNRNFTLSVFFRYDDLLGNTMRYYQNEFEKQYWITLEGKALFEDEQEELDHLLSHFDEEGKQRQVNQTGVLWREKLLGASYGSISYLSNEFLYSQILESMIIILSMAIGLLIGTLFIVLHIVKKVTKPIYQMTKAMDEVVTDNFKTKLKVESDDEIGYLSKTFNNMSEKLQQYFQQLMEKMEAEQEMKFGLLISQIDPHFVCNSLNTIKYLALKGRTKDIQVVASALSNILRDRLRMKNFQIYDTVQQETDTIRQYLTIQEYRYGGEVKVVWEIADNVKEEKIPKNMI